MNDSLGDERGGIVYYIKGQLATVGLDNSSGEGVHLIVSEKGLFGMSSGLFIQQMKNKGNLFVGETAEKKLVLSLSSTDKKVEFYLDSVKSAITSIDLKNNSQSERLRIFPE